MNQILENDPLMIFILILGAMVILVILFVGQDEKERKSFLTAESVNELYEDYSLMSKEEKHAAAALMIVLYLIMVIIYLGSLIERWFWMVGK